MLLNVFIVVVVPANVPLFNGNCMLYDVSRIVCVVVSLSVPCVMISFGNG